MSLDLFDRDALVKRNSLLVDLVTKTQTKRSLLADSTL